MPRTHLRRLGEPDTAQLRAAVDTLLAELEIDEEFPAEVLAEAERVAADPKLPDNDRTDLDFVTIDPPGSMDLDQAMCLQQRGDGFRVFYAIADVAAFVWPGLAIDEETRRRGQTLYTPTRRVPLHPQTLSEGAASLLPGQTTPSMLWQIDVDSAGVTTAARVERALVRSRERYAYAEVGEAFEAGQPPEPFRLLKPLGEALIGAEVERGGAGLAVPNQEIVLTETGYDLIYRPVVGIEQWNAQISLLTGRAAADIMLDGGLGILRTMPPPDDATIEQLRLQARALGVDWPADQSYQDMLRSLDVDDPAQLALSHESSVLFRGAGYAAFDGEPPEQTLQSAVGAAYAHVTAPLRRLVDRFGLETCAALCDGREVPGWVREALPTLPEVMRASDRTSSEIDRAVIDLAEAAILSGRVGETFRGVVVSIRNNRSGDQEANGRLRGQLQLPEPAVLAPVEGDLELGAEVDATLVSADIVKRSVRFEVTAR